MKIFKKKEIKTVKVGAVSPRIRLGDVKYNVSACIEAARRAVAAGVQILAFPRLTLTGATLGDMYRDAPICEYAEEGLAEFVKETAELDIMSFIGLPVHIDDEVFDCTAVVYQGVISALLPRHRLDFYEGRYFDSPNFEIYDFTFAGQSTQFLIDPIISAPFDKDVKLEIATARVPAKSTMVVICPVASDTYVGVRRERRERARLISGEHDRTFVFAEAGIGESTTDTVHSANSFIASKGEILAEAQPFAEDNLIVAEAVVSKPKYNEQYYYELEKLIEEDDRLPLPKNPFLSSDPEKEKEECLEALEIQAQGLAARFERSHSKSLVVGISGGLDSTLAILVMARAVDILKAKGHGIDRSVIKAITMP